MPTRDFTLEQLEDLDVPWTHESYERVDKRRWYNVIEVVFKADDKFYRGHYLEPASEIQEGQEHWSYNKDGTVTFAEVRAQWTRAVDWVDV